MRSIKIIIAGKEKEFIGPSTWSEVPQEMSLKLFSLVKVALTKKHLLYAVPMLVYKIPVKIMNIFIDARIAARKYRAGTDNEDPETLVLMGEEILDSVRWVYSEEPPSDWLLKRIELNGKWMDACASRLHGMTFGEFIFTEAFAERDHAKLAAVIYRKRSWWPRNGKRGPFVHDDIERFAKILREEKFNTVRSLIAWNYAGMLKHLHKTFPNVFQKPGENDPPAQPGISPWMQSALTFTDNDSSKFHALEKEDLYIALQMISNRIKQNKELADSYKK